MNYTDRSAKPLSAPPPFGQAVEVAEGVLWLRLPLPFQLDHVNVYLIRDYDGWAAIDVGISDDHSRAIWEAVLSGPLKGSRLSRLVITHHHPDHMGLAGWLSRRFDLPVHMTFTEYLMGRHLAGDPGAISGAFQRDHYARHGAPSDMAQTVVEHGHLYLRAITGLPDAIEALEAGRRLDIGGRRFAILTGGGHSLEQAMLYCREDGIFLAADQIIDTISPNVSVLAPAPNADPLGAFLASLERIKEQVAPDALTLPGHRSPLTDPHRRADELIVHHEQRCRALEGFLSGESRTVADLTPMLFPRVKAAHQMSFAFAETLAHVNRMIEAGQLAAEEGEGVLRMRLA